jgi:hypothetical protein
MRRYARGFSAMRATAESTAVPDSSPSPGRRASYQRRTSNTSSSACGRKNTAGVTRVPTACAGRQTKARRNQDLPDVRRIDARFPIRKQHDSEELAWASVPRSFVAFGRRPARPPESVIRWCAEPIRPGSPLDQDGDEAPPNTPSSSPVNPTRTATTVEPIPALHLF